MLRPDPKTLENSILDFNDLVIFGIRFTNLTKLKNYFFINNPCTIVFLIDEGFADEFFKKKKGFEIYIYYILNMNYFK